MNSEPRILHIFDPAIISETTIDLFEKLPFKQRYVVIGAKSKAWKANSETVKNVHFIEGNDQELLPQLVNEIKAADIVFIQAFSVLKAKAINKVKDTSKVYVWGLWGYALYNMANYFGQGQRNFSTELRQKKSLLQKAKDFYTFRIVYRNAVKKLDICLFLLESDFQLLGEITRHHAVWRTACYQTIENIVTDSNYRVSGNSILIGNSSTPSNRHEFVFEHIDSLMISGRKIIVPLNYGDSTYRDKILAKGIEKFGEAFSPLTDFLSLEEYTAVLQNCSHVILAHERQQAFGTILTMLYAGAKVYLSIKSPFYSWFKGFGITLFSVENDLVKEIHTELDEALIEQNRSIILKHFSEEEISRKLKTIVEETIELSKRKKH